MLQYFNYRCEFLERNNMLACFFFQETRQHRNLVTDTKMILNLCYLHSFLEGMQRTVK